MILQNEQTITFLRQNRYRVIYKSLTGARFHEFANNYSFLTESLILAAAAFFICLWCLLKKSILFADITTSIVRSQLVWIQGPGMQTHAEERESLSVYK
jgi:hypothetical protein